MRLKMVLRQLGLFAETSSFCSVGVRSCCRLPELLGELDPRFCRRTSSFMNSAFCVSKAALSFLRASVCSPSSCLLPVGSSSLSSVLLGFLALVDLEQRALQVDERDAHDVVGFLRDALSDEQHRQGEEERFDETEGETATWRDSVDA
jgi:hypothetical protein